MPERQDFTKIIADIEAAGISLYKIAVMMRRQYIQIQRMKDGGRVLHHEGEMLLEIHRVSR